MFSLIRGYSYGIVTISLVTLLFPSSWSFAQSCGVAAGQTYTSVSNVNLSQLCATGNRVSNNPIDTCIAGTAISSVNDINLQGNNLSWYCQSSASSINCGPGPSLGTEYARVACNATYNSNSVSSIITGDCGGAAINYVSTQGGFAGAFCDAGTPSPTSPTFPSPGNSVSWQCLGSGGGASASCTAIVASSGVTFNGACGININSAQAYNYTATNWLGTNQIAFCLSGNVDSSLSTLVANFPSPGGTTSWTCLGSDVSSSLDDRGCVATRTALSPVGICGPSVHTGSFLSLTGGSSGLCLDSTMTGFVTSPMNTALYTARYDRSCYGSDISQAPVACYAYQTPTPVAGMCNPGYNGQSVTYAQIQNATLCTQAGNYPILSAVPNSGSQWVWTCQGVGGAPSASCYANAVTDGMCVSYSAPQTQQPTNLCASGTPSLVVTNNGSYVWTCNGTNGGQASNLCSATCLNGQCSSTTTTGSNNNNTVTTGIYVTGMNGQTTPISLNQQCTDPDGCVCYNVTIVNNSICLPNTLTGVTDSIKTPIDVGQACTDADGCICHGSNTILNGTVCQTDGLTGILPGLADLVISQAVTSGTIGRRTTIDITLTYYNIGPNIATGTKVEYYLSPLIKSIRTSAPYTLVQSISSGYIQSNEYQSNVLVFPVGDVNPGENGQITISLVLNAKLTDEEITNATSIASRVRDPRPLNNAQKIILGLDDQTASVLGVYLVNPFIGIQSILGQYDAMNKWLRIDPVFQDVQKGDDSYMHIMTAVRNGIFVGYKFAYSLQFLPEKCTSRVEAMNVIARMMYTAGSRDVYVTRQNGTAYIDVTNDISRESQNFINRAHERGLIRFLEPKQIRGSYYLEPHKNITQGQLKEMFYLIYQRYGFDPSVMNGLLTDEESCVTRGDLAYLVAHVMRNNPNIMMGYNDEFLTAVVAKTANLSIAERRIQIQRMIDKLEITDPAILFANGYDGESLIAILEAAMAGRPYNPVVDVSSTSNFLYQKR